MNQSEWLRRERRNEASSERRRAERIASELKRVKRSRTNRVAIGVSFLFSFVTVVYAFSIPFRSAKRLQSGTGTQVVRLDPVTELMIKREASSQRRAKAFEDHADFLERLQRSKTEDGILPGRFEAKQQHKRQSKRVHAEIKNLKQMLEQGRIPEDDAIHDHMAKIEKAIKDAPK